RLSGRQTITVRPLHVVAVAAAVIAWAQCAPDVVGAGAVLAMSAAPARLVAPASAAPLALVASATWGGPGMPMGPVGSADQTARGESPASSRRRKAGPPG